MVGIPAVGLRAVVVNELDVKHRLENISIFLLASLTSASRCCIRFPLGFEDGGGGADLRRERECEVGFEWVFLRGRSGFLFEVPVSSRGAR